MSTPKPKILETIKQRGVADVARQLGVSRSALLSYCADRSREASRLLIEQRADRLAPQDGAS